MPAPQDKPAVSLVTTKKTIRYEWAGKPFHLFTASDWRLGLHRQVPAGTVDTTLYFDQGELLTVRAIVEAAVGDLGLVTKPMFINRED